MAAADERTGVVDRASGWAWWFGVGNNNDDTGVRRCALARGKLAKIPAGAAWPAFNITRRRYACCSYVLYIPFAAISSVNVALNRHAVVLYSRSPA